MGTRSSVVPWRVLLGVTGSFVAVTTAHSEASPGYGLAAAAQEITQLFWLADTASVCGWASEGEAARFKQFSVRFLSAHLPDRQRVALLSLVQRNGYEAQVKRTAQETAPDSCASHRWKTGWVAYKAAAEVHDAEF